MKIIDNGGTNVERYAVIVPKVNLCLTFSHDPYSPIGVVFYHTFGSLGSIESFEFDGKEIPFEDLPPKCQNFVTAELSKCGYYD